MAAIIEKQPGGVQKVLVYSSHVARQKLAELRFELVQDPADSPELDPPIYHLFLNLKTFLELESNEGVIKELHECYKNLVEIIYAKESRSWRKVGASVSAMLVIELMIHVVYLVII